MIVTAEIENWHYCEFHDEVEKARAVAECRSVAIIQRAGESTWQAHAWFFYVNSQLGPAYDFNSSGLFGNQVVWW